jgi:heparanase 1
MAARLLLLALACLYAPRWASAQETTVIVKGSAKIAETDPSYVCATMDWWPPEKCNYNQCPWGQSSILNLVICLMFLTCYQQNVTAHCGSWTYFSFAW